MYLPLFPISVMWFIFFFNIFTGAANILKMSTVKGFYNLNRWDMM